MANSKDSDESARDTAMTKEQLTAMLPYKIAEGLEHDRLQANNHCGTVRI